MLVSAVVMLPQDERAQRTVSVGGVQVGTYSLYDPSINRSRKTEHGGTCLDRNEEQRHLT